MAKHLLYLGEISVCAALPLERNRLAPARSDAATIIPEVFEPCGIHHEALSPALALGTSRVRVVRSLPYSSIIPSQVYQRSVATGLTNNMRRYIIHRSHVHCSAMKLMLQLGKILLLPSRFCRVSESLIQEWTEESGWPERPSSMVACPKLSRFRCRPAPRGVCAPGP